MTTWSELLEEDLSWREAELASLKRIALATEENEVAYRAILRANWAMLYAHFEGFTKYCWDLLLDQIQLQKVCVKTLNDDFRLLALEKPFKVLKSDLSSSVIWNFYNTDLPALLELPATFELNGRLDAESNLWPNIFERECKRIGINSSQLDFHRSRIKTLVARRNEIAHGMTMTIKSIAEYSEFEEAVLLVLHDLAIETLDILERQAFIEADTK